MLELVNNFDGVIVASDVITESVHVDVVVYTLQRTKYDSSSIN